MDTLSTPGGRSHSRLASRLPTGEQGTCWEGGGGRAEKGVLHQNRDEVLGDSRVGLGHRGRCP